MITIKFINTEATYDLRIKILRDGKPERYHFDNDDAVGPFHLGVFKDDNCVGIATFLKSNHTYFNRKKNIYQLRGMAVDNSFQSKGVGKLILERAIVALNEKSCELLWCNARENAVGFYKKLGFKTEGERFMVQHVGPYFVMYI